MSQPKTLQKLLKSQSNLLDEFIPIEKLPLYPLEDLKLKSSQLVLKDFSQRIVEELSEAYSDLELTFELASTNRALDAGRYKQQYIEEIADAWHFLLDFMLYAGITAEMMDQYISEKIKPYNEVKASSDAIDGALWLGHFTNYHLDITKLKSTPDRFILHSLDEIINQPELSACNSLNFEIVKWHAILLWEFTHKLQMACNMLKSKNWSTVEKEVNFIAFVDKFGEAFIAFIQYLQFVGFTEEGILISYNKKNEINHERIKNKY